MIDYTAPLADIVFALRYGAEAQRLPDWDEEIALQVLHEAARFIAAEVAPLDPLGDTTAARLEAGRVKLPAAFAAAFQRFRAAGWQGLTVPDNYGGQQLPHVLAAAVSEMLSGACASFQMVLSLAHSASRAILANGSTAQCQTYLPRLASGQWLATMCLTEAQAGSDLAQIRSMATPAADGSYRISGAKIFISGGDQDLTENIVHLVLARTPDAPKGVKGLSLFLCPAVLSDGSRNSLSCVRLEEKMGLHASPTCQMAFDGAYAELLGSKDQGLAHMFVMMNAQRLDVAVQGVGLADVAAQRSRAYAAERRQGKGADGTVVAIGRHDDVRRMLLTQLALIGGCRALLLRTFVDMQLGHKPLLIEFLTPLAKAFCTDAAVDAAQLAIQVHGGYGYLREYRVEQVLRDARITQIYEGTNGIQAATLADRVLRLQGGAAAAAFRDEVQEVIGLATPATAAALRAALLSWDGATASLLGRAGAGIAATSYLRLSALLAVGTAWARLEAAAEHATQPQQLRAAAAFFRERLLSECAGLARLVEQPFDLAALDDAVFE